MSAAIHLALTFDDKFWAPAYAAMRSVCLHTHRRADLEFHLITLGLRPQSKAYLDRITAEFGARVHHIDIGATAFLTEGIARLRNASRPNAHPVMYARLFLRHLMPAAVERLIYLDCDLFVRAPIERLHDLDLGDKALAACLDPYRLGIQTEREGRPRNHFDPADTYFNSGMMVIDLAKWREIDIVETIVSAFSPEERQHLFYDQDILNFVFRDRWLQLDNRWNFIEPRRLHEPFDPFIAHYTGPEKPWNLWGDAAFRRHYRHTMTNEVFYLFLRKRLRTRLAHPSRWLRR